MKKIIFILIALVFVTVGCKKAEKNQTAQEVQSMAVSEQTADSATADGKGEPGNADDSVSADEEILEKSVGNLNGDGAVNIETKQPERKVKYLFFLNGDNAVCFDDGTAFSVYDYYNSETGTGRIDLSNIEPNDTCKGYDDYLLIGDERWDLFDDSGRIREGWEVINYKVISQ